MKKLLFILIGFGASVTLKADTIDYCHVYFNHVKKWEFNLSQRKDIQLKISQLKSSDTMVVFYFNDKPCHDCSTTFYLADKQGHELMKNSSNINSDGGFRIAMSDLLKLGDTAGLKNFAIYIQAESKLSNKILLFSVSIQ